MKAFFAVIKNIADLVYPRHCAACQKPLAASDETGACASCMGQVRRNPKPYCALCGRSLRDAGRLCPDCRASKPSFAIARSACLYDGATRDLIHLFKYNNKRSLAGLLAGYMLNFIKDEAALAEGVEAVTFVPLHRRRLAERDFNQSELLGRRIASRLGLPAVSCLDKTRNTRCQNELPREARLVNLKGAFRVRSGSRGIFRDRAILLVDDVMTTGATLDECSRVLLEAGAREVRCVTLARGM